MTTSNGKPCNKNDVNQPKTLKNSNYCALILLFATSSASAVDVSLGAYIPAPAGKTIAMFYLGGRRQASEYHPEEGPDISHDTKLKTESALLRLFYMLDVSETRAQLQVATP